MRKSVYVVSNEKWWARIPLFRLQILWREFKSRSWRVQAGSVSQPLPHNNSHIQQHASVAIRWKHSWRVPECGAYNSVFMTTKRYCKRLNTDRGICVEWSSVLQQLMYVTEYCSVLEGTDGDAIPPFFNSWPCIPITQSTNCMNVSTLLICELSNEYHGQVHYLSAGGCTLLELVMTLYHLRFTPMVI